MIPRRVEMAIQARSIHQLNCSNLGRRRSTIPKKDVPAEGISNNDDIMQRWRLLPTRALRGCLMDTAEAIVEAIRRIPEREDLFNHYEKFEPAREYADAPRLRRQNLIAYLRRFVEKPPSDIWIADAPSRYGARWSGVPFTHQDKLPDMNNLLGIVEPFAIPAHTPETKESGTSAAIWKLLSEPIPLLWNTVMLHPYKVDNGKIRNRETTRGDQDQCRGSLELIMQTFRPKRVIAIGEAAETALGRMGIRTHRVHHPARNKHDRFWADMRKLGISFER